MKTASGSRSGMTLPEILIVVGITLILAAVLFPSLSSVRELGRRASCQSNLKQISLAFQQYAQDYNKKFPPMQGGPAPVSSTTGGVWILLQPYLKSTQIYQCPSETTPPGTLTVDPWHYVDYQYNFSLGFDQKTSVKRGVAVQRGLAVSALTQPALTVLANDSAATYPDAYTAGCGGNTPAWTCAAGKAVYDGSFTGSSQRHMKTQNFLFTDGHVQAYWGRNATTSASVWNYATPGSTSGNDPTYNPAP